MWLWKIENRPYALFFNFRLQIIRNRNTAITITSQGNIFTYIIFITVTVDSLLFVKYQFSGFCAVKGTSKFFMCKEMLVYSLVYRLLQKKQPRNFLKNAIFPQYTKWLSTKIGEPTVVFSTLAFIVSSSLTTAHFKINTSDWPFVFLMLLLLYQIFQTAEIEAFIYPLHCLA